MQPYTFLTRRQYFKQLVALLDTTKTHEPSYIVTMGIDVSEPLVSALVDAVVRAAKRGQRITLVIDALNFMVDDSRLIPGPLILGRPIAKSRGQSRRLYHALERIRSAGGQYHITNQPQRFKQPFADRSHIKGAVIGKQTFIGGCNLEHAEHLDVMVVREDNTTAHILRDWFAQMVSTSRVRDAFNDVDTQASLDNHAQLLLDAGVPGQSLIYDAALELIDHAEKWLYITCQYFPGGPTAKRLAAAQARGVRVRIDYSPPSVHGALSILHYVHQAGQRLSGLPADLFAHQLPKHVPKLHAKILASEKAVMVGSHNYVPQGVSFGTAELTLYSTDPIFSSRICDSIRQQIATTAKKASSATP